MRIKHFTSFFAIVSLLFLVACGSNSAGKVELTVEEILTKSVEAVATVESYSTKMDMNIDMMDMKSTMSFEGDITHNPDTMHMTMKMGMLGMTIDSEIYGANDEFYMSMFGEWLKMSPEEMGLANFQQLSVEEMEKFVSYADSFELTVSDTAYVLTLASDSEEHVGLIESLLVNALGDFSLAEEELEEMLASLQLNSLTYELHIDKKSFLQTYGKFSIDLELAEDGFAMAMVLDGEMTIFNVNEVEPIVVPAEIIENALTEDEFMMDLEDFDFGDFEFDEDFQFEFEEEEEEVQP